LWELRDEGGFEKGFAGAGYDGLRGVELCLEEVLVIKPL